LLSGNPPFKANALNEVFKKILEGKINFDDQQWKGITNEGKDFVKQLLIYDANDRPSASDCLKMKWIKMFKNANFKNSVVTKRFINLQKFNSERKLEMAVLSYIANFLTSSQNNKELREIFSLMDQDNDGVLSRDELITGLSKLYGK
jgi:calcium-dependent protein kinase